MSWVPLYLTWWWEKHTLASSVHVLEWGEGVSLFNKSESVQLLVLRQCKRKNQFKILCNSLKNLLFGFKTFHQMFNKFCCCLWLYIHVFYAFARKSGTLAAELAETNIVLFLTKIEFGIIWKRFSNFSDDTIWLKFKFTSITVSNCETIFHQYSYGFQPWFPMLSLGHLHHKPHTIECGSNDLCDRLIPHIISLTL